MKRTDNSLFEKLYILLYSQIEFALEELEKGNLENGKDILEDALLSAQHWYSAPDRSGDGFLDAAGRPVFDVDYNIFQKQLFICGCKERSGKTGLGYKKIDNL